LRGFMPLIWRILGTVLLGKRICNPFRVGGLFCFPRVGAAPTLGFIMQSLWDWLAGSGNCVGSPEVIHRGGILGAGIRVQRCSGAGILAVF